MPKRLSSKKNRHRSGIKRSPLERNTKHQRKTGKTFKLSLSLMRRRNSSFALIPLAKIESSLMSKSVSHSRLPKTSRTHGRNSKMTK